MGGVDEKICYCHVSGGLIRTGHLRWLRESFSACCKMCQLWALYLVLLEEQRKHWVDDIAQTEQKGLCSISCFTCLYLGLDRISYESLHQLVLKEIIEGSSWQQEFELPSHPGSVLSSPAGIGCHQWKCLGEENRAAGPLGGRLCLNPSEEEGSSAFRDLGVPSWSVCQDVVSLALHTPISLRKLPDSCINQISVASCLLVLGMVYIETLIYTCGLIFACGFIIAMVGSPNVSSYILNMLGIHIFLCFNRNFALAFNSSNVHGQHNEYLHVIIGCWCYCSAQEFWGMWSLCLALAIHKVSVFWISISESVHSLRLWFGFFFLPAVAHEARGTEERDAGQQTLHVPLWKNIGVFEPSGNAFSATLTYRWVIAALQFAPPHTAQAPPCSSSTTQ